MTATFPRRQAQPSEMWMGTKYLIENEMMNAFDVSAEHLLWVEKAYY